MEQIWVSRSEPQKWCYTTLYKVARKGKIAKAVLSLSMALFYYTKT